MYYAISTENPFVDSFTEVTSRLNEGRPVRMVLYGDQGSVGIKGVVASVSPFVVRVKEGHGTLVSEGSRVLVLGSEKAQHHKAEGTIRLISQDGDEVAWQVEPLTLGEQERRRYERRSDSLEVELRMVEDHPEGTCIARYSGTTLDISMGGSWIQLEKPIPVGSLVEFQTVLPGGRELKILSTVASMSSDRNGFGVEFMDFGLASRSWLFQYLNPAA